MKKIENNFIQICILAIKYHNDYNKENYLITYKILHLMQIYIINNIMNIIQKSIYKKGAIWCKDYFKFFNMHIYYTSQTQDDIDFIIKDLKYYI